MSPDKCYLCPPAKQAPPGCANSGTSDAAHAFNQLRKPRVALMHVWVERVGGEYGASVRMSAWSRPPYVLLDICASSCFAVCVHPRVFSAEQENLRGIVEPRHENHKGAGCAKARGHARLCKVQADQ
jgi:hypothetical protein